VTAYASEVLSEMIETALLLEVLLQVLLEVLLTDVHAILLYRPLKYSSYS